MGCSGREAALLARRARAGGGGRQRRRARGGPRHPEIARDDRPARRASFERGLPCAFRVPAARAFSGPPPRRSSTAPSRPMGSTSPPPTPRAWRGSPGWTAASAARSRGRRTPSSSRPTSTRSCMTRAATLTTSTSAASRTARRGCRSATSEAREDPRPRVPESRGPESAERTREEPRGAERSREEPRGPESSREYPRVRESTRLMS